MDKVSVLLPLIYVWNLQARINGQLLIPIVVKIVKGKRYNIFLLEEGETIDPGQDALVSHEPIENLVGPINTGIFACAYKDRFNPDFLSSSLCFRPIRTTVNRFVSPTGGSVVDLLWLDSTWTISDNDQTGLLPPFLSVAEIFKEEN